MTMEAKPITRYGKRYWEAEGEIYMQVGEKLIKVDHFDTDGKPITSSSTWSEETPNANGGQDCTVHMECLQIVAKPQELG